MSKIAFDVTINQQIINAIAHIDSFKGKWNIVEHKENVYLKELKRIATIESIGSSTRIEGARLTNDEIQQLLQHIKITKLKTRDQQEVMGYYDVLDLIQGNYEEIALSERHIFQLHQILLKHSNKDSRHRGQYKNLPNTVVANYADGVQRVIFNTTAPHLVQFEMERIIQWTNERLNAKDVHPLVVIALFVYEFLSIHPFQDGNGRLSRLLTNLLLMRCDYHFIQYISFENLIEKQKREYYEALMDGQKDRENGTENIQKWMAFFLNALHTLTLRLEQKYDVFKSRGGYLNPRQKQLKQIIADNQPVKLADIVRLMPDTSIHTLKKDLQYMRAEKVLDAVGVNKGTIYFVAEKSSHA